MIYMDHASTSPLRKQARQAMEQTFDLFGNPSSPHSAGMEANAALQDARKRIADALGCFPDELIFTSGGTEADHLALYGVTPDGERDTLIVSAFEHPALLQAANGCPLTDRRLPVQASGIVSPGTVRRNVNERTCLVSVMHANNELGTVQPIREIGAFCRRAGVLFHTDAVQTVGHLPICLREEPIDLLSLSAHKFGGPKGVGALYCRRGVSLSPLFRGGRQERMRRAGTESLLLAAGMAAALEASLQESATQNKAIASLRDELEARLCALGGIPNGSAERLPGFLSIRFPDTDAQALLHALDLYGVCISASAACHASSDEPSHALLAVGLTEREARQTVRITLGAENTPEEVAFLAERIQWIQKTNKT